MLFKRKTKNEESNFDGFQLGEMTKMDLPASKTKNRTRNKIPYMNTMQYNSNKKIIKKGK